MELEVGSGKGLFLSRAAEALPQHNFIGIELARKYAAYCAARLARRHLTNAAVIHGDASRFVRHWLAANSLAAVHIYFPDPWWKKRHRKRRLMNETFLVDLERIVQPGGAVHFWTDVEDYFRQTLELFARLTRFSAPVDPGQQPAQHDLDYRTHFERRTRLAGQTVYRAILHKPAAD
jgi:tRNA (guanine-N7-)-methyltransferase